MQSLNNFMTWLLEPFTEVIKEGVNDEIERKLQDNIVIVETKKPTKKKKKRVQKKDGFRPLSFDEYIGQEKAKKVLKMYIQAIRRRGGIFPHTLIHGKPGMGKTTLAKIMALESKVNLIELMSGSVTEIDQLKEQIHEAKKGMLFIDEIHALPRNFVEHLYPIMEDFAYNDDRFEKFTLIGATTEIGEILKDRKPFFDRFKIIIELENYTHDEMGRLLKQYKDKVFSKDKVKTDVYCSVSNNCRGTPRTGIRLLEASIYFSGDLETVLDSFGIIENGYTHTDLKTLKYIAENDKGVGLQGLSSFLDTSTENYTYIIEPYLIQTGLISRTPRGRRITLSGKAKIVELEVIVKERNE